METLENIVLSPAFAVILAVVGAYLFVIISREFFLWYFKMNEVTSKLNTIDERLAEIEEALAKLPSKVKAENSEVVQLPPTPGIQEKDSQFPLQH